MGVGETAEYKGPKTLISGSRNVLKRTFTIISPDASPNPSPSLQFNNWFLINTP